jgi:hypothetical protein
VFEPADGANACSSIEPDMGGVRSSSDFIETHARLKLKKFLVSKLVELLTVAEEAAECCPDIGETIGESKPELRFDL